MAKLNTKKIGVIIGAAILGIVLLIASSSIFESVSSGEIHVKQAAVSGDLSVIADPGVYFQWFGQIQKYEISTETFLSNDELDGGKGSETNATLVRFGDGGTAEIGSVTQWRTPISESDMLKIHRDFRSYAALRQQVRQWVMEVEKQTASTFKAEDTYSTQRGEFSQLISDQIVHGLYASEQVEKEVPTGDYDDDGNPVYVKTLRTQVKTDDDGNPIIVKKGIFAEYGLSLVNHTLKDIDFDETIDALIAQKKEAEQQQAVARANAERARQDAITAEETGKARIAQARADEEVKKITDVTQAEAARDVAVLNGERELRVAELAAERAAQEAEAELVKRRADAEANRLLVAAGLTPREAAEIDKDKAIGVARELAKLQLPEIMISGGNGTGGSVDPFTAVGLESIINIVDKQAGQ